DFSGREDAPIYELSRAAERIAAAAEAAHSTGAQLVLTARAENYLHGRPDLEHTIARLTAYEEAGADVLYAPGLRLPQLKLSRPGWCTRALRMAISETASTTHSKFAWPIHAASQSGAGLQKSIATGTPSRTANSTVFRS